ncbi:CDP-glucose 4,6-dehydratase [Haliea sp. E17]|uniref:CDP-glucose 4,6-dehydratase n=1 Tax=Haliea sp. E17 TaxID=3401576 RepID=UPI003AACF378
MSIPDPVFWRDKRVLLTGHTGFKGSWLTLWLSELGAKVSGISLAPVGEPNLFSLAQLESACTSHIADIRDSHRLQELAAACQPEIVIHMAAQPLVRASYELAAETFAVNVMGTVNLLESLKPLDSLRSVVIVTTDKVYRNLSAAQPFREDDPLGGHDPYSASKAACELVAASYRDSFFRKRGVDVVTARAGNVIGGGDWAEDRLVPDMVRAWQAGQALSIRYPRAVRPWQHVLEPLSAYLRLAEATWQGAAQHHAYNFGPETASAVSVSEFVEMGRGLWPGAEAVYSAGEDKLAEASWLQLDSSRAAQDLGVTPAWSLPQALEKTLSWYRKQHDGLQARELCMHDIHSYTMQA